MRKTRLKKLERTLGKKEDILLPLFLEKDGDYILFTDQLLKDLGENPEDYPLLNKPKPPIGQFNFFHGERMVSKKAKFIDRIEGDENTGEAESYLYIKGCEGRMIMI